VLVKVVLWGFRSAAGRAANGRMRVAHVLAKFGRKRCGYCDGLFRQVTQNLGGFVRHP